MGHFDDVQYHLAGGAVGIDRFNEGAIDFEGVEGERLEARKAGVAGTEVVDGHTESLGAQRIEDLRGLWTLEEGALRGFDLDVFGACSGYAKELFHGIYGAVVAKVCRGKVDGDAELGIYLEEPWQIARDQFEDPRRNELDHAALFSLRNEVIGAHVGRAASPANQGFGANNAACFQLHNRLIQDVQTPVLEGATEHGGKRGVHARKKADR